MSEFLPKEVRAGLEHARKSKLRQRSRMRVRVGNQDFTILRHWDAGFSLGAEDAPHLRGHVDIYDGARHVSRCLIIASAEENGEMQYEYKRATAHLDSPPLDYVRDDETPVALLAVS